MRSAEDVGALRHEVHAAEDDELGGPAAGGRARELQRVADEVRELDDLVALIVMPEDDQPVAELRLGFSDPRIHLVVGETEVSLRERLPLADARLLDVGEELDVHVSFQLPATRFHARSSSARWRAFEARFERTRTYCTSAAASSGASGPVTTL